MPLFFVGGSGQDVAAFVAHFHLNTEVFQVVVFGAVVGEDQEEGGVGNNLIMCLSGGSQSCSEQPNPEGML